jgi:hypothetical protein
MTPPVTREWLLGTWQLLRHDSALEFTARTRMHFGQGDVLSYTIPTGQGDVHVSLQWTLSGDQLTTAHADGAHAVSVRIARGEADVLEVDFAGPRAWFVRDTN